MKTDNEVKDHAPFCYVRMIPFEQRTLHSCNCSEKEKYKKNFDKNRKQLSK